MSSLGLFSSNEAVRRSEVATLLVPLLPAGPEPTQSRRLHADPEWQPCWYLLDTASGFGVVLFVCHVERVVALQGGPLLLEA